MPVNLTISNIDSKRMVITIEWAKGKEDRLVRLPQMLLTGLREYYKKYKPKFYH
jgi:integrase/recombinase XerD